MSDDALDFRGQRHKPPTPLKSPRELIVACAPMRSNVNVSRITRAAGCFGARAIILCGAARVIAKIARDGADAIEVRVHRTLAPPLRELKQEGYRLVGLEQATGSRCLYDFPFERKTAIVVGNERLGLEDDILKLMDHVVEIPVYGMPSAHNVATAASIALYEFCRQFPDG